MFITHSAVASATLFTIPYVCMHERSYRIYFYCNLHLKMMSCKRLSIDSMRHSTLYKKSIFSRASTFFPFDLYSGSYFLFISANVARSCVAGILYPCLLKILGNTYENILQEPLRSMHLFIFCFRFVSVDK